MSDLAIRGGVVYVGNGSDVLALWGEQNGHRFAITLTPDEAGVLAAKLTEQARHARGNATGAAAGHTGHAQPSAGSAA